MTNFKKWRLDNNYSQRTVAKALGCHVNTVCNWDIKDTMNYKYREKFIEVYDIDPEQDLGLKVVYRAFVK